MLKGHRDHYISAYLPLWLTVVGTPERFLSRMATIVLGAWHQMLRYGRKSSAALETDEVWLAIVPVG